MPRIGMINQKLVEFSIDFNTGQKFVKNLLLCLTFISAIENGLNLICKFISLMLRTLFTVGTKFIVIIDNKLPQ